MNLYWIGGYLTTFRPTQANSTRVYLRIKR